MASDLSGKLEIRVEMKSKGDLFHQLLRHKPHQITHASPETIQGCELHEGEWGAVGSVLFWNYFEGGKAKVFKCVIDVLDEDKHTLTLRGIEGDTMELYKKWIGTYHVEKHGDVDVVTWVLEYERKSEDIPVPTSFMDWLLKMTKDIDAHHIK